MAIDVREAFRRARNLTKKGEAAKAAALYEAILEQFPGNGKAISALATVRAGLTPELHPSQQQMAQLASLYSQAQLRDAREYGEALATEFTQTPEIYSILGAVNADLGQLENAIACWKKAISIRPNYASVHNNLGVAFNNLGRQKEAAASYTKAIQFRPDYAEGHYNLGVVLNDQGRREEAIASYTKAIELKPDYAEAHNNLGTILNDLGKPEEAIVSCSRAIQFRPDFAEGYSNLGAFYRGLGRCTEAIASYTKAIQLRPEYVEAHKNLGDALMDFGNGEKAVASYSKAIQLKPDYAEAYNKLGVAFNDLGRAEEAIASCRKAIQFKPDFAQAHNNLGTFLRDLGRSEEAVISHNKAIQFEPGYAEAYNNLGAAFNDMGRAEEAVSSCAKAIQFKPDYAEAHNNMGVAKMFLGRQEEAITSYRQAIQIKPDCAEVYRNLSDIKQFKTATDPLIRQMSKLLASDLCPVKDRMQLSFALAKANADLGEHEAAIIHLAEGNRIRKAELNYDRSADVAMFSRLKTCIAGDTPSLNISQIAPEKVPVFIVGMPRSGTTLVEQILASHSCVHGAGELALLGRSVHSLIYNSQRVNESQLQTVRDVYLSGLASLNAAELIITDKMPSNFLYIGFILRALPEAKIIHVKRDARATCWSIYKHYFSIRGNGYAYSPEDVATFYKMYIDLMAYWNEHFHNPVHDIHYESLTENQEQETCRLLQYLDLEWEDTCDSFYKTERAVATASSMQVRQPMYTAGSEEWRKYEKHLKPMFDALTQ